MPLINLSSKNQQDDAKFSNYFNENIIVEPNSYIALVHASVIEDANYEAIVIGAGVKMCVRYDPLNQIEKVLNATEVTYTSSEFVTHVNNLFGGLKCFGSRFEASIDGDDINFKIFYATNFDFDTNYLNYVYGTLPHVSYQLFQKYPFITQPYFQAGGSPTGYDIASITSLGNNWNSITFKDTSQGSGSGKSFIMPRVPYNYSLNGNPVRNLELTAPDSNNNILSIISGVNSTEDVGSTEDTFSFFTVSGCPDKLADPTYIYELALSNVIQETAGGAITAAAVTDFQEEYSHRTSLLFLGTGVLNLIYYNYVTNQRDKVYDGFYKFGDHFTMSIARNTTLVKQQRYVPNFVNDSHEGLVFWFPNNLTYTSGLALNFNTYVTPFYPYIDYLKITKLIPSWDYSELKSIYFKSTTTELKASGGVMGCWAGSGINTGQTSGNVEWKGLVNDVIDRDTAVGEPWETWATHTGILRRLDTNTPEPPTNTSSKRQIIVFNQNLVFKHQNCVSFLVYFKDDSVSNSYHPWEHTLMGANNQATFTAFTGQNNASGDIQMGDNQNSQVTIRLDDALGTRINIGNNKWYHFVYQDSGLVNGTTRYYSIYMTDLTTGTVYQKENQIWIGNRQLNDIVALGGRRNDTVATLTERYMYGIIADFRVYANPRNGLSVANDWNALRLRLTNGYLNTADWTDTIWGKPTTTILYNDDGEEYCCMNESNLLQTYTPQFICEEKPSVNTNGELPDFVDIHFPHNVKIPVEERTVDLPKRALIDYGSGFTEAENLDKELDLPGMDANFRILNEVPASASGTGEANPIFNISSTPQKVDLLDEVLNVEIPNLPHRTFNGTNNTIDKTIYQLPVESRNIIGDNKITEHSPATKVWLPLNNPMEIPLNRLEVQISKEDGKKVTHLNNDTHVSVQIESRNSIFN